MKKYPKIEKKTLIILIKSILGLIKSKKGARFQTIASGQIIAPNTHNYPVNH